MKLAIEGTIVMSDDLRNTLDAMYDARLPEKWAKISWQSTTLGFWYTELLERDGQFRRWCYHGRPKVHSCIDERKLQFGIFFPFLSDLINLDFECQVWGSFFGERLK